MTAPLFERWSPMMTITEWDSGTWSPVRTVPCDAMPMHPGAMAIQFGQSIFEGTKAFWAGSGPARTFRLRDHHQRLIDSADRMFMPAPSRELFLEAIQRQVEHERAWRDPFSSSVLYIRPLVFGLESHVMPVPSSRHAFIVLTAPIRFSGSQPLALYAERRYSRAGKGGLGFAKTASNYAHQFLSTSHARQAGCDVVLWLDPESHTIIQETSSQNVFFVLDGQLVTPPVSDTVLAGITRRSVIELARSHGVTVLERAITLEEVLRAAETHRLQEMFMTSTALGVRPVARILDGARDVVITRAATLCEQLGGELLAIQSGTAADPYGWTEQVTVRAQKGAF